MNLIQELRIFLDPVDDHQSIVDSSCLYLITKDTRIGLEPSSYPGIEKGPRKLHVILDLICYQKVFPHLPWPKRKRDLLLSLL